MGERCITTRPHISGLCWGGTTDLVVDSYWRHDPFIPHRITFIVAVAAAVVAEKLYMAGKSSIAVIILMSEGQFTLRTAVVLPCA